MESARGADDGRGGAETVALGAEALSGAELGGGISVTCGVEGMGETLAEGALGAEVEIEATIGTGF